MKKFLFIYLLTPIFILSQSAEKIDSLIYQISSENKIYTEITGYCNTDGYSKYPQPSKDAMLFVSGYTSCNKFGTGALYFIKVMYGSNEYYSPINLNDKVYRYNGSRTFSDFMDWYDGLSIEDKKSIKNIAKELSEISVLNEMKEMAETLNKYESLGIAILNAVPTDNYSMTGAKFKIMNFSKQTIKYITFNFYGKNPVDDKVIYRKGTYNVSRKGIGPVQKYGVSEWEFDDVWLTDIVETLRLFSVNIQYTNGTSRTIKITKSHWLNEDYISHYKSLSEEIDAFDE